jgi:hypothetical protein
MPHAIKPRGDMMATSFNAVSIPGPRMAKLLPLAVALVLFAGCAQQPEEQLPSANFNGPIVTPPPAPVELVKPAPKTVTPQPRPAPQVTAVPRDWTPSVRANNWNWIVIHHSATPTGGAKAFDKMHKQKGWDELGYHFVIGNGTDTADGQVEVGPRWSKQKWGAHTKTPDNRYNEQGIGICLVGNFDNERPTQKQLQALARLVSHLQKTYKVGSNDIIGHGQAKATDCPGRNVNIDTIRRMAAQMLADSGAEVPNDRIARTARGELLADIPAR